MKKVTLLTSLNAVEHVQDDHYLVRALEKRDFVVRTTPWESLVDGQGQLRDGLDEDLFLVRSTWNYTDHLDEFLRCLEKISDRLLNPLKLIRWNSNKRYLLELCDSGLPVLPLAVVKDMSSLEIALDQLGGDDFVIKPVVGASAIGLCRFDRSHLPVVSEPMVVQRFYPEIHQGEASLIFIDKKFSYAVLKTPSKGDIRVQEEYGGVATVYQPNAFELESAEKIIAQVSDDCLYARVDMLPGLGLMELECIEPSLFFSTHPKGAEELADAVLNRLG